MNRHPEHSLEKKAFSSFVCLWFSALQFELTCLTAQIRDMRREQVFEFFDRFARVQQVRLILNPETKKSKGYAFVEFRSERDARRVLEQVHRESE